MKSIIIAIALFTFTAATIAFYPESQSDGATGLQTPPQIPLETAQHTRIDVVFALDTTGSMGGLIQAAKEKIWSIATSMTSAQSAPEIRMGLVAYRDRGDAYVTRSLDLSTDLDSMYAALMDFRAQGGGDTPESVNQALSDAVHKMSWSQHPNTYKVVFLVGDAPPHMDYQDEVQYPQTVIKAREKGIVVNAIQCGMDGSTTQPWKKIALLGRGQYVQVDQGGSAVAISTPYDKELAELSAKLDATRLYYGTEEAQEKQRRKVESTDKLTAYASVESRARRAAFNITKSGEANLLGTGELVAGVSGGRVELSEIAPEQLPKPMQDLSPKAQAALIDRTAKERGHLQAEIKHLAIKRSDFLKQKAEEKEDVKESLDYKLYDIVRDQAGKKGIKYEADAPAY